MLKLTDTDDENFRRPNFNKVLNILGLKMKMQTMLFIYCMLSIHIEVQKRLKRRLEYTTK